MKAHASPRLARQGKILRYELVRMFTMRQQRFYYKAQTKIARRPCEISGQVMPVRCYPYKPRKDIVHWITTA